MKFRLKTTLCMVCLVSLLFGAGSCALISLSFQNALEREEAAAKSAYELLFHTLQLVETVEVWSQPQDVVQVLQQLSAQGNSPGRPSRWRQSGNFSPREGYQMVF